MLLPEFEFVLYGWQSLQCKVQKRSLRAACPIVILTINCQEHDKDGQYTQTLQVTGQIDDR